MYKLTINNRGNQALYDAARKHNLVVEKELPDTYGSFKFGGRSREEIDDEITLDIPVEVVVLFMEIGEKALLDHIRKEFINVTEQPHLRKHVRWTYLDDMLYMSPTEYSKAVDASNAIHQKYAQWYAAAKATDIPVVGEVIHHAGTTLMVVECFDGAQNSKPNTVHVLVNGQSLVVTAEELCFAIASGRSLDDATERNHRPKRRENWA